MAKGNGNGMDIKALAAMGAQARMVEIESEIAALRKTFPELAAASEPTPRRVRASEPARRKRSKMSAAARAAVSKRMKKYWQTWRAEHA